MSVFIMKDRIIETEENTCFAGEQDIFEKEFI